MALLSNCGQLLPTIVPSLNPPGHAKTPPHDGVRNNDNGTLWSGHRKFRNQSLINPHKDLRYEVV